MSELNTDIGPFDQERDSFEYDDRLSHNHKRRNIVLGLLASTALLLGVPQQAYEKLASLSIDEERNPINDNFGTINEDVGTVALSTGAKIRYTPKAHDGAYPNLGGIVNHNLVIRTSGVRIFDNPGEEHDWIGISTADVFFVDTSADKGLIHAKEHDRSGTIWVSTQKAQMYTEDNPRNVYPPPPQGSQQSA